MTKKLEDMDAMEVFNRCYELMEHIAAQNLRYEQAILWALGQNGEFREKAVTDPPYWWRSELRRRAGLKPERSLELDRKENGNG